MNSSEHETFKCLVLDVFPVILRGLSLQSFVKNAKFGNILLISEYFWKQIIQIPDKIVNFQKYVEIC